MYMAKKRKSTGKKRTLSPEQLAKMQAGKKAKAEKAAALKKFDNVEKRLSLKDD